MTTATVTTTTLNPKFTDLFTRFEIIFWSLFLGIPTALAVGAHFTPQDPPVPFVGWAILWAAVLGMWGGCVLFFLKRWQHLKNLRFRIDLIGLTVGWSDSRWAVKEEAVKEAVADLLAKMQPTYPNAAKALAGCVLFFREPTWVQQTPGFVARKVAGLQDGMLLVVGWNENLKATATEHEMAHRVLQVFGGDPGEAIAHDMMRKLGVN